MDNKNLEEIVHELADCYRKAREEFVETGGTDEYWQGKKDAFRIALTLLNPENRSWKLQLESSPGLRYTLIEKLQGRLIAARYSIGALLWEHKKQKKIDYRTYMSLVNWISDYDFYLAKEGVVPELPDALDVYE